MYLDLVCSLWMINKNVPGLSSIFSVWLVMYPASGFQAIPGEATAVVVDPWSPAEVGPSPGLIPMAVVGATRLVIHRCGACSACSVEHQPILLLVSSSLASCFTRRWLRLAGTGLSCASDLNHHWITLSAKNHLILLENIVQMLKHCFKFDLPKLFHELPVFHKTSISLLPWVWQKCIFCSLSNQIISLKCRWSVRLKDSML